MIQTWYLSNDFQMFVAAIPCAVLFKWKIWAAYAYLAALMGGSLGYTTYLMSHFLSTFCDMNICGRSYGGRRMLYNGGGGGGGGYGYSSLCDSSDPSCSPTFCDSPLKTDVQIEYYDKPWTRFPPYGIGMLLALLLVHLRREPVGEEEKGSIQGQVRRAVWKARDADAANQGHHELMTLCRLPSIHLNLIAVPACFTSWTAHLPTYPGLGAGRVPLQRHPEGLGQDRPAAQDALAGPGRRLGPVAAGAVVHCLRDLLR
eukprot:SAG22_NODE_1483_length_4324_cov_14.395266_4_plen_258_part_00